MSGRYTDHHVHLLSTAAARLSIDVSAAEDVEGLIDLVRAGTQAGGQEWVRAWGYEEWALAERRHPTREDLDRATSRPLVLHHRSGHAAVLNSPALAEVGLDHDPDGLLVDRHDVLSRVPRLPLAALEQAVAAVSAEWSSAGVDAVVDATHTNGAAEIETLDALAVGGFLSQTITAMASLDAVDSLPGFGASVGRVKVGWVKLMPHPERLGRVGAQVASAHSAGYPVAVHVVDIETLDVTLEAFERSAPPPGTRDRIEHNALSLPEQVARIAACDAMVVVNPGFLLHRRVKYEREVSDVERHWLVRIGSLIRAGVPVRAGSDSPVTPARPAEIIDAAQHHPFAVDESVSREAAEALLRP